MNYKVMLSLIFTVLLLTTPMSVGLSNELLDQEEIIAIETMSNVEVVLDVPTKAVVNELVTIKGTASS